MAFRFTTLVLALLFYAYGLVSVASEDRVTSTTDDSPCSSGGPPSKGRYRGARTLCREVQDCTDLAEPVEIYRISQERSVADVITVAFLINNARAAIYRENERVPDCTTISGPYEDEQPPWITRVKDPQSLRSYLETHCFSRLRFAGGRRTLPFKSLYKVTGEGSGQNTLYIPNLVAHVIPNSSNYSILRGKSALDEICTCWNSGDCKRFGQRGLTKVPKLQDVVSQLSRSRRRGSKPK